jgi:hypothetical protein
VQCQLPHQWAIGLSPVGYFSNEYALNSIGLLKQTNEWRISPGIIKSFNKGKLKNWNRLLYDASFAGIGSDEYYFQSRFRVPDNFVTPLFVIKKENRFSWLFSNETLPKGNKGRDGFDEKKALQCH